MPTIQQQLNQLKRDKETLNTMLNTMGVETTGNETFTQLTPLVGKIVTDPILQDKSIEITENGTTNITADEGFDGLNNVEVVTNVASSGGGSLPEEKCIAITDWDEEGNPIEVLIRGYDEIPQYCFYAYSSTGNYWQNKIKKVVIEGNVRHLGHNCFQNDGELEEINLPDTIESLGAGCFSGCSKLKMDKLPASLKGNLNQSTTFTNSGISIKTIPDGVTGLSGSSLFKLCTNITQISMRNVEAIGGSGSTTGAFNGTGLIAVWIGSAITSKNFARHSFNNCTSLQKIFIDLPRATVEAFTNYQYAFMNDTTKTGIIVCNDDEGFMTKEEFDSIDWSTYTG